MTDHSKKNFSFGRVCGNVFALLTIFLVSLLIIVAGHYTVQREMKALEGLTQNEETRIELNNLLQQRLQQIKTELQAVSLSRSEKEINLHFFDRILENANRIYFESHQQLDQINQSRNTIRKKNERIIFGVTLGMVLLLLVAGSLLIRDIRRILKEREKNFALIHEYNENLEKKVDERTRELEELNQGLKHEVRERKKAEKIIQEQTDFLTNVIEAISHPFYVINVEDYSILLHNSAARELGDPDSLTCYQLTHRREEPCKDAEHPCPLRQVVQTGKPSIVEHVHVDRQGEKMYVEVHGYPIFDQHGKVSRMIEYSLDITTKKEAEFSLKKINEELESRVEKRTRELAEEINTRRETEQELRKLSRAVEQSSSTVVVTNTNGVIEYVNQGFSRATGYSAEEAIGQNPSILASGQTPDHVYKELWKTISSGDTWTGEFINKKKNGELYEESVIISPIRDEHDKITHYIAIKEDISELKNAWRMAEEANRAKSFFLANMSHEIRTPMNAIIGMTRLALDSDPGPKIQYFLETIQTSSASLLQLINDILDFSKIEANQLELENISFSPRQTVETVVQSIRLLAEDKRLGLDIDIHPAVPEMVSGDTLRLGQILLNILSNAIKFTDHGGITLHVERLDGPQDHVWLKFVVKDTGKGIAADKLEHIFDYFAQEDSSVSRKYGGTGLGLAICQKLCRLMGGEIQVQSIPGRGSSFILTLPFQPADMKELTSDGGGSDQSTMSILPLHVLLVEDNQINRELATMVLERDGHEVVGVENGLEALEMIVGTQFDCILMDIQMPVMDGLTCSRIIRAFEQGGEIDEQLELPDKLTTELTEKLRGRSGPIVAMTAHAMSGDREKCLQAGMDDYLTKPFEPEKITAVLNRIATDIGLPSRPSSKESDHETASEPTVPEPELLAGARAYLENKFNLKKEQIDQLLEASAKSFAEHLDRLEQAVSQADHDSLAATAHAIKGSLLNLGLNKEAESAKKIELAAKGQEQAPYDQYLQELRKGLEKFYL